MNPALLYFIIGFVSAWSIFGVLLLINDIWHILGFDPIWTNDGLALFWMGPLCWLWFVLVILPRLKENQRRLNDKKKTVD